MKTLEELGLGKAQLRITSTLPERDTVKKMERQALGKTSLIKEWCL